MNWTVILSIATAVIQALSENCPQQNAAERRAIFRSPKDRHLRAFEVAMRRECCNLYTGCMTLREWRQNKDEIMERCCQEAAEYGDAEVDQLMGNAAT